MSGICFRRILPVSEPDNIDSPDFRLCTTRFTPYGKHRLSGDSLRDVRIGGCRTKNTGKIQYPAPASRHSAPETRREGHRALGDPVRLCRVYFRHGPLYGLYLPHSTAFNGNFAEFVHSKAGFRNRPTQVFLFLVTAATLGTACQIIGYYYFHLPETVVAFSIAVILFLIFEWTGKYFAPAGALAFIPLLLPREGLIWLPLQAAVGAALFIATALIVFQRCYQWKRAQLIYCLTPTLLRKHLNRQRQRNT